jgi:NADPH-dependent 2,4-dienoyl-CoA reductase/sulfur reductase-like enzyme
MPDDVLIIGAGPYGLATAAHLRRAGVSTHVLGAPMAFWRSMPAGMCLRSNRSATNIAETHGELSLSSFEADTGLSVTTPLPLARFVDYGGWVQRRAVPDIDRRLATRVDRRDGGFRVTLEDGEQLASARVVVACGIAPFAWRPPEFAPLYPDLASHTGDHADLGRFAGQRVAVLGGGQSALECAALMHAAGAEVEVFVRDRRVIWLRAVSVHRRLGRLGPVLYAPTDVGPLWYSRLNSAPDVFRRLPRSAQERIAARSIRPACSHWVRERLGGVPIRLSTGIVSARRRNGRVQLLLDDGSGRDVDHLLLGTGYRVDVRRYPFLAPELLDGLRTAGGYAILGPGMESSVPGLHVLGAPAAWSFGPIMRFVSGTWYSAAALTRAATAGRAGAAAPVTVRPHAEVSS